MNTQVEWTGTVVKKGRGLLDGSNMYRRLQVRMDDGTQKRVRVDRSLWKRIEVGDRLVKPVDEDPRPA